MSGNDDTPGTDLVTAEPSVPATDAVDADYGGFRHIDGGELVLQGDCAVASSAIAAVLDDIPEETSELVSASSGFRTPRAKPSSSF